MLSIKKDLATLMELAIQRSNTVTLPGGTTLELTPGSIARLLLAVTNAEFEQAYDMLNEVHLQSFISTATGSYIDMIGELVNCSRLTDESDENYKYRVSKQVTTLETSNELAVRMGLLSISHVSDVKLKKFTHGSGSFTAFIITDSAVNQESVIKECKEKLDEVSAFGIRHEVAIPTLVQIGITIKIVFKSTATNTQDTLTEARTLVREYINSRTIGEEIIINAIIEKLIGLSDDIYDVNICSITKDNSPVEVMNLSCRDNERFIESSVPSSINIL